MIILLCEKTKIMRTLIIVLILIFSFKSWSKAEDISSFEIEGINHDSSWYNNIPAISVNYFITKSIFEKKNIIGTQIDNLLSKKNRNLNEKKLSKIISYLQIK